MVSIYHRGTFAEIANKNYSIVLTSETPYTIHNKYAWIRAFDRRVVINDTGTVAGYKKVICDIFKFYRLYIRYITQKQRIGYFMLAVMYEQLNDGWLIP